MLALDGKRDVCTIYKWANCSNNSLPAHTDMKITERIQRAEALMEQGDVAKAKALYDTLCRVDHLTVHERGIVLFGLGACFLVEEDYDSASSHLKESWELLFSALGAKDPYTIHAMVLLSRSLIANGNIDSGMEIGRSALQNLIELYGPDAEQTATASFFLSAGAFHLGHLAEAENLTVQAMDAWKKNYGPDSLQVATCLDALGKLREVCGEKRPGLDFYRQALEIKLKVLGDHEITAVLLGHVGIRAADAGAWDEAVALLERSLACFQRLGTGKNAKALAFYRKKLTICQQILIEKENTAHEPAH